MNRKCSENKHIIDFTQKMLSDTAVFPYILIHDYKKLGIDEKQLITLLRILHPFFRRGSLSLEDIGQEFSVSTDDAWGIITPFLDKRLLEENPIDNTFTCSGIINCFYENWITGQRKKNSRSGVKHLAMKPSNGEREIIRNLTQLFHSFEKELGKNLSPIQSEEIRSWLEKDNLSPELIEEALKRAVLQDKRSFAYIKSILKNWRQAGYSDLQAVLQHDRKPVANQRTTKQIAAKKSKYSEIYEKY